MLGVGIRQILENLSTIAGKVFTQRCPLREGGALLDAAAMAWFRNPAQLHDGDVQLGGRSGRRVQGIGSRLRFVFIGDNVAVRIASRLQRTIILPTELPLVGETVEIGVYQRESHLGGRVQGYQQAETISPRTGRERIAAALMISEPKPKHLPGLWTRKTGTDRDSGGLRDLFLSRGGSIRSRQDGT